MFQKYSMYLKQSGYLELEMHWNILVWCLFHSSEPRIFISIIIRYSTNVKEANALIKIIAVFLCLEFRCQQNAVNDFRF